MKLVFLPWLLSLVLPLSASAQSSFQIDIIRISSTQECTMGYLSVDDEIVCYTLELPWLDNQNNISCIPSGSYSGVLRYDKSDGWRIQLENVPNRTGVQIHIGNYTSQIKGCVLVGNNIDAANCTLLNSADAYKKIKTAFYGSDNPSSSPDKPITVNFM